MLKRLPIILSFLTESCVVLCMWIRSASQLVLCVTSPRMILVYGPALLSGGSYVNLILINSFCLSMPVHPLLL